MKYHAIFPKPIITERSFGEAKKGKYTFRVDSLANKEIVKRAIESLFNVTVVKINTLIVKGKTKRFGQKSREIIMGPWKKAIVQIGKDQKIDLFETGAS